MIRLRTETLAFILILSAAMLLFLHQLQILRPAEDFAALLSDIDHYFAGFREAQDWRQKYEERQALIDQLLVENTQLREKEKEVEVLRESLSFKQANPTY